MPIGVTNHPTPHYGVTKHPARLAPLLGTPSLSIKHKLFNCQLVKPYSGGPPNQPPTSYGRERVTSCSQICTYHGINTRYVKGYTARLSPQSARTPPAVARRGNAPPKRLQKQKGKNPGRSWNRVLPVFRMSTQREWSTLPNRPPNL